MKEGSKTSFFGTLSQKELLKLYAKHVNSPKVRFFKGIGLGVILGEREGVKINTLEGPKSTDAPMTLYNCHTCGGVYNLGHGNPRIVQILKDALDSGLDIGDHLLLSEWRAILGKKIADLMPPGITKTTFGVSEVKQLILLLNFQGLIQNGKNVSPQSEDTMDTPDSH